MKFSRRELLKCLAAGGAVVAGELWVPGSTKIFLPSKSTPFGTFSGGQFFGAHGVTLCDEPKVVTMTVHLVTEDDRVKCVWSPAETDDEPQSMVVAGEKFEWEYPLA